MTRGRVVTVLTLLMVVVGLCVQSSGRPWQRAAIVLLTFDSLGFGCLLFRSRIISGRTIRLS